MNVIVLALGSLGLISSSKAASPVQIDVYYESMCPDSASFFSNQLVPTYKKLSDHMAVNLIPYGIASYEGKHDEYTFSCQHGPEECYGNMVQADTPVQIDVYYESMCPDSASFFSNQLVPSYEKLSDYMIVNLIPYGNANHRGKHDEYTFTCQHGSEECYGNMVQTCYSELVNNTESSIKFINCAFNTRIQRKSVEKCIKDSDLRRQIKKCATGSLGRNLEYEMAKKTDALQPPHNFIPWITVNGVGGSEINNKAIDNLMGVVCDEITDPKPDSCLKNKWNYFKRFRNYYL